MSAACVSSSALACSCSGAAAICRFRRRRGSRDLPIPAATAQTASPTIALDLVAGSLSSPLFATHAGDGSNRLFLVERGGLIKVLQPGGTTPTTFLNISAKIAVGSERGLLGLAFHPQYESNRRFFVNYTCASDGATVVAEYLVSATNANDGLEASERILLVESQPYANHNGGWLGFGPDGYLYIAMGDGGDANDPENRAQNITTLLGKILRIDIDPMNTALPYESPPDNPFFGPTPGRDEIYAVGMRNPWRCSFDRGTGQLYVGDVGQGQREEIDVVENGDNYGWRRYEGTRCTNLDGCDATGLTMPIAEYSHSSGRCSITGGYVYRGGRAAVPVGAYIYGDYCTGEIFMLWQGQQSLLLDTSLNISSFGEDEAGELYVVNLNGAVYRLRQAAKAGARVYVKNDQRQDFSGSIGQHLYLKGNLARTGDGVGLGGRALTFKVDGQTVGAATTIDSGSAWLSYRIPASLGTGAHTVTVEFAGDTYHQPGTGTGLLTVSKASARILVKNDQGQDFSGRRGQALYLKGRVWRNTDNSVLGGISLSFKVDGQTVGAATTFSSGSAWRRYVIPANAALGGHTVTVEFAGDALHDPAVGTGLLTVSP